MHFHADYVSTSVFAVEVVIKLDRPRDNFVSVTFAMVATEFAEAAQVVKIRSITGGKDN
jgi:hypothetical protein